jgi:hypothetical protein
MGWNGEMVEQDWLVEDFSRSICLYEYRPARERMFGWDGNGFERLISQEFFFIIMAIGVGSSGMHTID